MAEQGKGFAGLLGNVFGTTPPAYMEGLLGQQATEDLRKRSIGTGIANALLGYAAMPKNRDLGLGRILAGAAQAGIGGARGVYDNAKTDYLQGQAIAEAKRKQEQDAALQGMIGRIADPNEKLLAQLAPKEYVASKVKPVESPFAKPNLKDFTHESVQIFNKTRNPADLRLANNTESMKLSNLIAIRDKMIAENPNNPNIKYYTDAIQKESTFAPAPLTKLDVNLPPNERELLKSDTSTLEGLVGNANKARSIASTTELINSLVGDNQGSGVIKLTADVQNFLGISGEQANVNQAVSALATKAATEIRTPGSGSTSDTEFNAYRAAFPSLATSKEGRELMVKIARANAQRNEKLADWTRNAIRKDNFSYGELGKYDDSLGKAVSDEIFQRVKQLSGIGNVSADQQILDEADAILRGEG